MHHGTPWWCPTGAPCALRMHVFTGRRRERGPSRVSDCHGDRRIPTWHAALIPYENCNEPYETFLSCLLRSEASVVLLLELNKYTCCPDTQSACFNELKPTLFAPARDVLYVAQADHTVTIPLHLLLLYSTSITRKIDQHIVPRYQYTLKHISRRFRC